MDDGRLPQFQFGGILPAHIPRIGTQDVSSQGSTVSSGATGSTPIDQSALSSVSQNVSGTVNISSSSLSQVATSSDTAAADTPVSGKAKKGSSVDQPKSSSTSQSRVHVGTDSESSSSDDDDMSKLTPTTAQHQPSPSTSHSGVTAPGDPIKPSTDDQQSQQVLGSSASAVGTQSQSDTNTPAVPTTSSGNGKGARRKPYSLSSSFVPPEPPTHNYKTHSDR